MAKTIRSLIGLSLLLAAVSASAQVRHTIQVTVPFPFVTAQRSWAAADYQVEVAPQNGILTLSSADIPSATMLTSPDEGSGGDRPHLVFHCVGAQWVLQQVVIDGLARALPLSAFSKEQAKVGPTCQGTIGAGSLSVY